MVRDRQVRPGGSTSNQHSTPRKRSGDALIDDESPPKKQYSIIQTRQESATPSARNNSSFAMSDPFTASSSFTRSSPALPSYVNLPHRSSVPREDREDSKEFSRGNTVDPGLAVLGEPIVKLVDLITTMRDRGIAGLDIDLPQIVVVGDQSTGKSSLIEGLSAIKVPRKEGTCTRCPLEINLKATDGDWHCRISIVKQYGYKVSSGEADTTLGLGPWNKKFPQAFLEPFVDVSNKNDIPTYLARAQLAVLNPSKPIRTFAIPVNQHLDSEMTEEAFSPNVIRLDIKARKLPSLSFFDLPGVIVQDVEPYVPKMIKNLVKSYISSSRSLVLLTVPMDNDRANSSSAGLVHDAEAQNRSIGIISKPDRLVASNIEQWKEILQGRKFQLRLGYRVVMNPAEATIEHAEARRQERDFFSHSEIFNGPLAPFQDRFGTEKLQVSLSSQLLSMIRKCLPEIEAKVEERVENIEKELLTLPKLPDGNVVFEVQQKLVNFERQLTAAINNTAEYTHGEIGAEFRDAAHWFQIWHKVAQAFFEKIVRTAPRLDLSSLVPQGDTIVIGSDSEDGQPSTPSPNKTKKSQGPTVPAAIIPSSFSTKQQTEIDNAVEKYVQKFTLAQLRKHLHSFNGGVYGVGDPRVFANLFHESIGHWSTFLKDFLRITAQSCKKLVQKLIEVIFSDLKETELFRRISESAKHFIIALENDQLSMSRRLLNIERGKPLTLDGEGQEMSRRNVFEQLNHQLQDALTQRKMDSVDKKPSSQEQKNIAEQVKIDADQHHQELHELAGTIAYYKVSARRFADYNSLTIRNEFFHTLREKLWRRLATDIGLGPDSNPRDADAKLQRMMVPSPRDYQRRKELEHELDLLESTKQDVLRVLDSDAVNGGDDLYGDDMEI